MYGRAGLDRFKKARTVEPFSVSDNVLANNPKPATQPVNSGYQNQVPPAVQVPVAAGPTPHVTQLGGGQSNWQPPDWAIEPRPGVYYLEVIKDGEVLDRINLDKRRHIFGRQVQACDFVLDHQSVSRQHAAVITHKNGSIYVIDLGSAHGTFVANERLTKDSPVELEAGQSLKFAASTRTYILRKNNAALFPPQPDQTEINLPPPPDPLDEEAVLAYNTFLNRYGLAKPNSESKSTVSGTVSLERNDGQTKERASKRSRRTRVVFKDQVGGELVEVVGVSDGYDVETEPGPVGVKEGSLVGKYESLVKITVIPKGKEQSSAAAKEGSDSSQTGVTEKLKQVFDKVKTPTTKSGMYDDLYGDLYSAKVGSSWAYSSNFGSNGSRVSATVDSEKRSDSSSSAEKRGNEAGTVKDESDDDDLFG